jgi:hypothetical protein
MSTTPSAIAAEPSEGLQPALAEPEVVETPTTAEEPIESETPAEPEAGAPEPGTPSDDKESKEDGRRLPAYVRDLKEKNPEGYKRAKAEFYDLDARRSVHPTVQAAREEHQLVADLGGPQGITKLREDGQVFKTAAQQFLKGDPGFVKDLFEEDPIAAALHVPHMLETFREKDKAGYQGTLARLWDTEFQATGFANGVKNLLAAIAAGDKETATAWAQSFGTWQEKISGIARQQEDPRVKTLLAERQARQENEAKAQGEEFLKGYRTEATNGVVEDGSKTFDSYFKGRKIDEEDRKDLLRESFVLANRVVEADKEFLAQRQAHIDRGDSQAAVRLTRSRFAREDAMPSAVKKIARRYGMFAGPAAKPAPPNPQGQPPRNGAAPAAGWVKVNARPQAEEIDRQKSPPEMIISGKAVLKSGRKVDWSHLKRTA